MCLWIFLAIGCNGGLSPIETQDDTDPGTSADTEVDTDTEEDTDAADCEDDRREENDSPSEAYALDLPADESRTICRNDPDYYSFETRRRCTVTSVLTYDDANGILDLVLYKDGIGIGSDTSGGGTAQLGVTADADGEWVLGVEGRAGVETDYTLVVTEDCGAVCTDDLQEDNDTRQTARGISGGGFITSATACEGDPDYWRLPTSNGCTIDFSATSGTPGVLSGALLDNDGRIIAPAENNGSLHFQGISGPGSTTIRVESSADASYAVSGYVLCVTSAVSCPGPDSGEPNNSSIDAFPVAWGASFGGTVCGDHDWYVLPAAPGCSATFRLNIANNTEDLQLEVGSPARLGASETTTTIETVTLSSLPDSPIYMHVYGASATQDQSGYTLSSTLNCH